MTRVNCTAITCIHNAGNRRFVLHGALPVSTTTPFRCLALSITMDNPLPCECGNTLDETACKTYHRHLF